MRRLKWPWVRRSRLGLERLRADILQDERNEAREALARRDAELLIANARLDALRKQLRVANDSIRCMGEGLDDAD